MAVGKKIRVGESEINVISVDAEDYISLIWEEMYNPHFNSPEFGGIMNAAGTNRFLLSVKQWVEKTNRGTLHP